MNSLLLNNEIKQYHKKFKNFNRIKDVCLHLYFKLYHRYKVIGLENIPEGPALLAANHSGGFDLDIQAISHHAHPKRKIEVLIDQNWHFLNHWWGRYFIGGGIPLWTKGGTRYEYLDPYLKEGGEQFPGLVCIFPEGHSGSFRERKNLNTFYPGVTRIAIKYEVPIVPVANIGFHYAVPILKSIPADHRADDIIFIPIPLPWKLRTIFGEPFELSSYYGKTISKEEEYWVSNNIVRPKIKKLLDNYYQVNLTTEIVSMKKPLKN